MSETKTKVTTSHWGAFSITVQNGSIVAAEPFQDDPNPSQIPKIIPAAVHHSSRILRPSVRRGWLKGGLNRGRRDRNSDVHIDLPWDEALDIAAEELKRVRQKHGNRAIFGGSYGWASAGRFHHALSQVHRFLNTIGGYVSSFGSYSTGAAQAIMPHVLGMQFLKLLWGHQNHWPAISSHTETLVMFGGINCKNSQVSMGGVTQHETMQWLDNFSKLDKTLITISPQKSDGPDASEWFPIIPGTDTALMLALAYELEVQNLIDINFLNRCTIGYDRFRNYLLGRTDGLAKTPEWAAEFCGIKSDRIKTLARRIAKTRTLITVSWSLQRAQYGEQPYWMATVLASMLGQIGMPGGGVGFGYGAIGGGGVPIKRLKGLSLPQGSNPVADFIPVARIADMLLTPGAEYNFNGRRLTYPPIKLIYWCGGNPFHHHQDLNRFKEAWKTPDTIIVHETWWTATAKRADIVFPATTPYERTDIGRASSDPYLFFMEKLISPVGGARNDYDIFSDLSKRLGVEQEFTEGRSSEEWLRSLYLDFQGTACEQGISIPGFDELRTKNWVKLPVTLDGEHEIPFSEFRKDPLNNSLDTPSGRIEIFSETIDSFNYSDCRGHPIWKFPDEWLGSHLAKKFPLHLVSPQPKDKLHSQLECALSDIPGSRPMLVKLNYFDAKDRNINDGGLVRIFNDRGSCLARASLSSEIRRGVVSLPTGAWHKPLSDGTDSDGNPNVLTLDVGTSNLGQGSSAHTALVQVKSEV